MITIEPTPVNAPISLVVRFSGWGQFLTLRRRLTLPLRNITSVRPAPDLRDAGPHGIKLPGSRWPFWPGPFYGGQYLDTRGWTFWCVFRPKADELLRIDLTTGNDNRYRMVVLQVPDAAGQAEAIQRLVDDRRPGITDP